MLIATSGRGRPNTSTSRRPTTSPIVLVQHINAETVRLDISSWYLSEHAISIAIANRSPPACRCA